MSKKIPPDLIGFKDFIDYQSEKKTRSPKRVDNTNYDLISFLEKDSKRLDNMVSLFEEKAYMIKNYPQDTKILVEVETENIQERIEIIELLKDQKSSFRNNLNELFLRHFS